MRRAHIPGHGKSTQPAATDFSLSPGGRGDGKTKSQRESGHRQHPPCSQPSCLGTETQSWTRHGAEALPGL